MEAWVFQNFLAIFSVLSPNSSFSGILWGHFWSEYVSRQPVSAVIEQALLEPRHVGFHQSNGPLTHTWIQPHFIE